MGLSINAGGVRSSCLVYRVSIGLIAIIFAGICFLAPFIDFAGKTYVAENPLPYSLVAFACIAVLLIVYLLSAKGRSEGFGHFLTSRAKQYYVPICVIACIFLLIAQLAIVNGCWFTTGWDVGAITDYAYSVNWSWYFSRYPNQIFLAVIFKIIARGCALLGFYNGYLAMVFGGCFCVSCSVLLCALCAQKIAGYCAGYLSLLLGVLLAGVSPWIMVPYSDTYGMLWVALSCAVLVYVEPAPLKWGLLTACAIIGYAIKPTIVFVFASALFIAAIELLLNRKQLQARSIDVKRQIITSLAAVCIAGIISFSFVSLVKSCLHVDIDSEASLGIPHFLMMGANANPDLMGVYNDSDVNFSVLFSTAEERNRENIRVWLERVGELGPVGLARLFFLKSMANYCDGTFFWEGEGLSFYTGVYGDNDVLKTFYGIGDCSEIAPWEYFAQVIWLVVLLGLMLSLFDETNKEKAAFALALLMLTVFLGIFERRSRYLFLYLPVFITLASGGLSFLFAWVNSVASRSKH